MDEQKVNTERQEQIKKLSEEIERDRLWLEGKDHRFWTGNEKLKEEYDKKRAELAEKEKLLRELTYNE